MKPIRALLVAMVLLSISAGISSASVFISVNLAPPVIPVYVQPPCPAPGYLWTPGYWAYGPAGYYWVPGVWVRPPVVGVLWTPGYWGFGGGIYRWHPGYWGPRVGFYGGINYGFGYTGVGFAGGYWRGGAFYYNRAVANVNVTNVRNVYVDRTVVNRTVVYNHASFNGPGGITVAPTRQQQAAMRERQYSATSNQTAHQQAASMDRSQFASVNHGRPAVTAMNSVNGRRYTQQGRIARGIGSGELTARESRNLEGRETGLNRQIRNDREGNGGRLTPEERQQIRQRQNNLSGAIHRDNHNAARDAYGNSEVGERRQRQQERIAQGVRSGQMSPSEAARTEGREQNINRQNAADRRANGGKLTPQERRNINRKQNRASRQIEREKHNGQRAPE